MTADGRRWRRGVAAVLDPELPVLTIDDLGILRDVPVDADGRVVVDDHTDVLRLPGDGRDPADVGAALAEAGLRDVEVRTVLAPAGPPTGSVTPASRKLRRVRDRAAAPRRRRSGGARPDACAARSAARPTPREISRFGSTACKALWRCKPCREPFDHFKAL